MPKEHAAEQQASTLNEPEVTQNADEEGEFLLSENRHRFSVLGRLTQNGDIRIHVTHGRIVFSMPARRLVQDDILLSPRFELSLEAGRNFIAEHFFHKDDGKGWIVLWKANGMFCAAWLQPGFQNGMSLWIEESKICEGKLPRPTVSHAARASELYPPPEAYRFPESSH